MSFPHIGGGRGAQLSEAANIKAEQVKTNVALVAGHLKGQDERYAV